MFLVKICLRHPQTACVRFSTHMYAHSVNTVYT